MVAGGWTKVKTAAPAAKYVRPILIGKMLQKTNKCIQYQSTVPRLRAQKQVRKLRSNSVFWFFGAMRDVCAQNGVRLARNGVEFSDEWPILK